MSEQQSSAGSGEEWNPTDEQVRSAAMWYRHDLGLLTVAEATKVKTEARLWLRSWQKEVAALRAEPQTAGAESHSLAAMEGEKDTIVNLIHEHVGFEVLLAIESGVLTGVEKAAEAILAELGRRSQAVSAQHRYDQDGQTCPTCGRVGNSEG